MDYGISLISGAVHKYYDDIQDNEEPVSPLFLESVKVLMITIMTINFIRSPGLSAFFLIIICIYWSLGRVDSDFWKACMSIPVLTCLVNYEKFAISFDPFDAFQRAAFVLVLGIGMYFEDGLIPEETSLRKTLIRIALIAIFLGGMWMCKDLSSFPFIGATSFFIIGYLISNILYHSIHRSSSRPTSSTSEKAGTENAAKKEGQAVTQQVVEHTHESDSSNPPLTHEESE
jgi:hypothetical protein